MSATPQSSQAVMIDKAQLDALLAKASAPVQSPMMPAPQPLAMVPAGQMVAQVPAAQGVLLPFTIDIGGGELSGYLLFPDVQSVMSSLPAILQQYPIRVREQRQGWGNNGGGNGNGGGWGGNRQQYGNGGGYGNNNGGGYRRGGRW